MATGTVDYSDFIVEHTYPPDGISPITATVRVTDSEGGVGSDEVVLRRECDATGDISAGVDPAGDLIGCSASYDSDTDRVSIGLTVDGDISPTTDIQYRVSLDTDLNGTSDYHLRWDNAKAQSTGLPSLEVTQTGVRVLTFSFLLTDIGRSPGDQIQLAFETQGGVPGEPGAGILDNSPDEGFFVYVIG